MHELNWQLSGCRTRDELADTVMSWLLGAIPSSWVSYISMTTNEIRLRVTPDDPDVPDMMLLAHRRGTPADISACTLMRQGRPHRESGDRHGLTAAELDVLRLVGAGLTAVAIGHVRRVSPRTVRKQLQSIYAKLGMHDRLQVVSYARSVNLIDDPAPELA